MTSPGGWQICVWLSLRLYQLGYPHFSCHLKPHGKFQNPTITSSGGKVTKSEEREKEKREGKKRH